MTVESVSPLARAAELSKELRVLSASYTASPDIATRKRIVALSVELRECNWRAQQLVNSAKEATARTKRDADAILLDLQNIQYQHRHLKREIEHCDNFDSRHHTLDMVSRDEFLTENPHWANSSEHTITIERLKDEETRRLALFVRKTQLQEARTKLAAQVKDLRDDLEDISGLEHHLARFNDSAESLKAVFYKH